MFELMGAPSYLQDLNLNSQHPFRRGPMYSAYAELREWKLRTKNLKLQSGPLPPPTPSRKPSPPMVSRSIQDFSMAFRKENKKPPSTPKHGHVPFGTPPPATAKHVSTRASSGIMCSPMRKSYSCLKELKDCSMVASSAVHAEGRRKNSGNLRRQKQSMMAAESAMSVSWMG